MLRLDGNVEDQAKRVADLAEDHWTDIAVHLFDTSNRDGPNMLTLCSGSVQQAVVPVGIDCDLRRETAKCAGQRNDLDHGRVRIEDALSGHNNSGMTESCLSTLGKPEIEIDDITRGQHRASRLHRA